MKNLFFAACLASLAACSSSGHSSAPANASTTTPAKENVSLQKHTFGVPDPASQNDALLDMHQKIEVQRQAINQEKAALDTAISKRDSRVHFGKDLMDTIAYGVSSGALGYDFMKKTNSLEKVQAFFNSKKISGIGPAAEASEETALVSTASTKAQLLTKAGTIALRSTEAVSAVVLGVFFVGNVYNTGNDIVVWFDSTEQIRAQRLRLAMAEKSLEVAEKNLETAVQSNKDLENQPGSSTSVD